ncbi:MAG: ABC transporter ATP-binding protein [Deltaproteobacteria bacterium]|nr:ABC transporter ATP-binding protein [Deltaproteobacteria bacterium]
MNITVDGLMFGYDSRPVLEDIHFEVPPATVLAVLGQNGAGKSTLLQCMARILEPKSGCVALGQTDLSILSRRELGRLFGYVPQAAGEQSLTVFDTVLLGRRPFIRWAPNDEDLNIVREVLDFMGLSRLAHRPASELSGGELQKVLIARALAQKPRVLLMDEPASSLDLKNQLELVRLMSESARKIGFTAVISVHDVNLALRFADWFLLLKDRRVHALVPREALDATLLEELFDVRMVMTEVEGWTFALPIPDSDNRDVGLC